MALTLRRNLNRVLTKDEVDDNFVFLNTKTDDLAGVVANLPFVKTVALIAPDVDGDITDDTLIEALGVNNKVDKITGKGLSTEDFTSAEKTKLAGLEGSHFRGTFLSIGALTAGVPTPVAGDYADVDSGTGSDATRYIWDATDSKWVSSGSAAPITAAQVKTLYESNPDTNAFTDAEETKLAGIAAGATANSTDSFLRARANHTGTQTASTISDFQAAVEAIVGSGGQATLTTYKFNLSAGQSVMSGADLSGNVLAYTIGQPVLLTKDGFALRSVDDYTGTNGTSIALVAPAESDCQINIVVFGSFNVANTYSRAEIDAKTSFAKGFIGETIAWKLPESTIPGGCLPENGQIVDRATYPDLWAKVSASAVTDAVWLATPYLNRGKFSSGNGTTTFRMPDTNGKHADGLTPAAAFLRGYGKNSSGEVGLFALDQVQTHQHARNATGFTELSYITSGGTYQDTAGGGTRGVITPSDTGVQSSGRQGTETRPVAVAVIWLTIAANNASNIGSVDVTALATSVTSLASRTTDLEFAYSSGDQTWSNGGTLTLNHGMAAKPSRISIDMICTIAENGYAVGTVVNISGFSYSVDGVTGYGHVVYTTDTQIIVRIISNGIKLWQAVTNASFIMTPANWRFRIKASKS